MQKNEILEKSRNEKNDEYEKEVLTSGNAFSVYTMLGVFVLLIVLNTVFLDITNLYDYSAILFAFVSSTFFYRFVKTKETKCSILGIVFAFVAACFLALYILTALKIV